MSGRASGVFVATAHPLSDVIMSCLAFIKQVESSASIEAVKRDEKHGGYRVFFSEAGVSSDLLRLKFIVVSGQYAPCHPLVTRLTVHDALPGGAENLFADELRVEMSKAGVPVTEVAKIPVSEDHPEIGSGNWRVVLDIPEIEERDAFRSLGFGGADAGSSVVRLPSYPEPLRVTLNCCVCGADGHSQQRCGQKAKKPETDDNSSHQQSPAREASSPASAAPEDDQGPSAVEQGPSADDHGPPEDDRGPSADDREPSADDREGSSGVGSPSQEPEAGSSRLVIEEEPLTTAAEESRPGEDEAPSGVAKTKEPVPQEDSREPAPAKEQPVVQQQEVHPADVVKVKLESELEPPAKRSRESDASDCSESSGGVNRPNLRTRVRREASSTTPSPYVLPTWVEEPGVSSSQLEELRAEIKAELESSYMYDDLDGDPSYRSGRKRKYAARKPKTVQILPVVIPHKIRDIVLRTQEQGVIDINSLEAFLNHVKKKSCPAKIAAQYTDDVAGMKAQLEMIKREFYNTPEVSMAEESVFMKWFESLIERFEGQPAKSRKKR